MTTKRMKLPYLQCFFDRRYGTGKMRFYVRDPVAKKRVAIAVGPDHPEFMAHYRRALTNLGLAHAAAWAQDRRRLPWHRGRGVNGLDTVGGHREKA